jgi:hypothetical protein
VPLEDNPESGVSIDVALAHPAIGPAASNPDITTNGIALMPARSPQGACLRSQSLPWQRYLLDSTANGAPRAGEWKPSFWTAGGPRWSPSGPPRTYTIDDLRASRRPRESQLSPLLTDRWGRSRSRAWERSGELARPSCR